MQFKLKVTNLNSKILESRTTNSRWGGGFSTLSWRNQIFGQCGFSTLHRKHTVQYVRQGTRPNTPSPSLNITGPKSWIHQQHTALLMNAQMSSTGHTPICLPTAKLQCTTIILLLMIQSGDIELNQDPRQGSIFQWGMYEIPVTWSNEGVCCTCCSVWHHKSCIELCTTDYELLQRSNVQWSNGCAANPRLFTTHTR